MTAVRAGRARRAGEVHPAEIGAGRGLTGRREIVRVGRAPAGIVHAATVRRATGGEGIARADVRMIAATIRARRGRPRPRS